MLWDKLWARPDLLRIIQLIQSPEMNLGEAVLSLRLIHLDQNVGEDLQRLPYPSLDLI